MSKFTDELKKRHNEQEQRRIGDIYSECVERGCDIRFLKAFDTRMWLFPIEQTKTFLDVQQKNGKYSTGIDDRLKQWKIYLQVIIEKRPNHEKANEWKRALELLNK